MNKEFRNYVSTFTIRQISQLLYLQKDKDVVKRYNDFRQILSRLESREIDEEEFIAQTRNIEDTEDLVYRLSNEFMDMTTDQNPYTKTMTLPLNEKFAKLAILLKYISTYKRLHMYYTGKSLEVSQELLDGLSVDININTLEKIYNQSWDQIPLEGPGHIKYDLSLYNTLIEEVEQKLTKVKQEFEASVTA
jgi:hypothetical protein